MSQHVPMSSRARTAADIIIVYSRRPWESGRHCAFPPLVCSEHFLGEGCVQCGLSAWYARAECCRCLVSSIRLRIPATLCGIRCWVRRPLPNDDQNASTPDDRASGSEDFGERGANAKRKRRSHHNLVSKQSEIAGGRGRETRNQDSRNFRRAIVSGLQ